MSMMYMVWNFPGQFGSAVLSQPLAYSQPTHGAAELETEKAFGAVKALLSNSKNMDVLPALFWSQM